MHYHGTKLNHKKLGRTAGPRRALLRGLLDSLILYERIETTETKAKTLAPYFEAQVTRAKKQTLASYRQILAETINPVAGQKLYYDLVNGFKTRQGGYTRIIKTGPRLGDGASMAIIELVLDSDYKPSEKTEVSKPINATNVKGNDTKAKADKTTTKIETASKVKRRSAKPKTAEKVTTKITSGRKGSK
jgi:large subunit ribosomal protein L17